MSIRIENMSLDHLLPITQEQDYLFNISFNFVFMAKHFWWKLLSDFWTIICHIIIWDFLEIHYWHTLMICLRQIELIKHWFIWWWMIKPGLLFIILHFIFILFALIATRKVINCYITSIISIYWIISQTTFNQNKIWYWMNWKGHVFLLNVFLF